MMQRIMNLPSAISPPIIPPRTAGNSDYLNRACSPWYLLGPSFWLQVREDGFVPEFPEHDAILVPLALWQARREDLEGRRGPLGVVLQSHEDLAAIDFDLARFNLIAIRVARSDGGYGRTIARLLRERHGYQGELVAVGNAESIQIVDLFCNGFDAFAFLRDEPARSTRLEFSGVGQVLSGKSSAPAQPRAQAVVA